MIWCYTASASAFYTSILAVMGAMAMLVHAPYDVCESGRTGKHEHQYCVFIQALLFF